MAPLIACPSLQSKAAYETVSKSQDFWRLQCKQRWDGEASIGHRCPWQLQTQGWVHPRAKHFLMVVPFRFLVGVCRWPTCSKPSSLRTWMQVFAGRSCITKSATDLLDRALLHADRMHAQACAGARVCAIQQQQRAATQPLHAAHLQQSKDLFATAVKVSRSLCMLLLPLLPSCLQQARCAAASCRSQLHGCMHPGGWKVNETA